MRNAAQFAILVVGAVVGCGGSPKGIHFSPDSLNGQAWPAELNERAYFRAAGVYARNLSGLVGHVLYPKKVSGICPNTYSAAEISLEQYLRAGTKLDPDTTAVERYSDKINAKASIDTSVLTFTTKLAANQAAEVLVADTTTLIVPDSAIDVERLKADVPHKAKEDDCEPYFIRGAIITTVTYRTATEVEGDASVSGTAFGANGKVYNAASRYSLDYRLGITVLPVTQGREIDGKHDPKALRDLAPPEHGFPAR